jgi:hypothetical protein
MEYAEVETDPVGLDGELVYAEEGLPCAVSYRVTCYGSGTTRSAVARLRRAGNVSERRLLRSPDGQWTVDERSAPELAGLQDVDLSVTPSTNILPIRRMHLGIGQDQEVVAAWVKFPSLEVAPLRQIYRRVSAHLYEYEAPDLEFRCQLTVDEAGAVETYGSLWTRLASSKAR